MLMATMLMADGGWHVGAFGGFSSNYTKTKVDTRVGEKTEAVGCEKYVFGGEAGWRFVFTNWNLFIDPTAAFEYSRSLDDEHLMNIPLMLKLGKSFDKGSVYAIAGGNWKCVKPKKLEGTTESPKANNSFDLTVGFGGSVHLASYVSLFGRWTYTGFTQMAKEEGMSDDNRPKFAFNRFVVGLEFHPAAFYSKSVMSL